MSQAAATSVLWRRVLGVLGLISAVGVLTLGLVTHAGLRDLPQTLDPWGGDEPRAQILDRNGLVLNRTFDNPWNVHDGVPLHATPQLLRKAFIEAEDQRFFEHGGVDWRARSHALVQNLRARRAVRGASTITEQVVRMLHPRDRTIWSRWLEGFEARQLERRFSKGEIFEFYLNQVPYARRRRGVVQAARDYFDRDLETLNEAEQLALVVLVRSPSRFDLARSSQGVPPRVEHLAVRLHARGTLDAVALAATRQSTFELSQPELEVSAPHFVRYVRGGLHDSTAIRVATTLDGTLHRRIRKILETQIEVLSKRQVGDGAALVVDHRTDEVLAWVNAGAFHAQAEGSQIDAVLARRQPGSTLKPFVYALALEQGWTAATMIEDTPYKRPVGRGQHSFRNYSRRFYGPVRLRQALGNSLNIPAVRAAAVVTPAAFLARLQRLGFDGLDRHPDFYGEGLALGNGEVTLFELVSAYASLARGGTYRTPRVVQETGASTGERRVFEPTVSSLIADILSDPEARRLEFSANGVLTFPVPTAVKTGTSNDYRDAWALGFSDRYTAGVWMGNLDLREMRGVSGSQGPALVLRAIFSELERRSEQRQLFLSPKLQRVTICSQTGAHPGPDCPTTAEWFRPGHEPAETCALHRSEPPVAAVRVAARAADAALGMPPKSVESAQERIWLAQPSPGLNLARDPRIPDEMEAYPFEIDAAAGARIAKIEWLVDGATAGETGPGERRFLWPLAPGRHEAQARVWTAAAARPFETVRVAFYVK